MRHGETETRRIGDGGKEEKISVFTPLTMALFNDERAYMLAINIICKGYCCEINII
ncbi:hypothetical protein KAX97_06785 [candidate division WOR-3 bacterium]|nr:hypothetical protein [candidate division WOR-3 bacterium]